MGESLHLKVHGRGNAWPVLLGERHPFYDHSDYRDLANAAFSLFFHTTGGFTDILVDAGHGTIQSLISGDNRIPDCICLTHGHMDHTLSVDWVVQSFWQLHQKERRYPIYATMPVYRFLIQSYPHLEALIEFRELLPGKATAIGPRQVKLTCFPVYHGPGAVGASMLLFEAGGRRVLFTGDLFSPLLRGIDYQRLKGVDLMVVDCNNRFPWPRTSHWSFAGHPDLPGQRSEPLLSFLRETDVFRFTGPHQQGGQGEEWNSYLQEFVSEWDPGSQPFTILEFLERVRARKVVLVHYSGAQDQKYYGKPMLSSRQLRDWVNETDSAAGTGSTFVIPGPGEEMAV
jgi:glyoxylase-like metal-dependent hydrolase (beta-lactamase superfamily II)